MKKTKPLDALPPLPDTAPAPATYTGRYAMHKYWSKKPHNLVANYIQQFSRPGDIVLDAFCGSGVTVIESVRLQRRAIGVDINPVALLCTRMGLEHVDIARLTSAFEALRREVSAQLDALYHTICPRCGHPHAIATHTIWEHQQPHELWVACQECRSDKIITAPTAADSHRALNPAVSPDWHPDTALFENGRINARAGMRIADLFTPRALAGLALLLRHINAIEDQSVREVLRFCFSAMLPQASKMVFVIRRRGKTQGKSNGAAAPRRAEVGSWVIGYWLPGEHFEIHVWRCFENRFRRILKGKHEVHQVIPAAAQACCSFDELAQAAQGFWVHHGTALHLAIPDASIDYIFTDPPHGNRIPYLELSLLWNAWLGYATDWEGEIVLSEARHRQKDTADYQRRLATAFCELWRVLKPDHYMAVVFHSLDDATWLALLNTCISIGFEVVQVAPLAYSARSVVQDTRRNALKTDVVITCQKRACANQTPLTFHPIQADLDCAILAYLAHHPAGSRPTRS